MSNSSTTSDPLLLNEVLAAPLGDLIASVGQGVADAQRALDEAALATHRQILEGDDPTAQLLRSLGYQPTWYSLPETTGSLKLALTMRGDSSGKLKLQASTLDASYTNHYEYQLELASKVEFKIVPVPPPQGAETLLLVPDLEGLDWTEALAELLELGLEPAPYSLAGVAMESPETGMPVLTQRPEAGEMVLSGGRVVVVLGPS